MSTIHNGGSGVKSLSLSLAILAYVRMEGYARSVALELYTVNVSLIHRANGVTLFHFETVALVLLFIQGGQIALYKQLGQSRPV